MLDHHFRSDNSYFLFLKDHALLRRENYHFWAISTKSRTANFSASHCSCVFKRRLMSSHQLSSLFFFPLQPLALILTWSWNHEVKCKQFYIWIGSWVLWALLQRQKLPESSEYKKRRMIFLLLWEPIILLSNSTRRTESLLNRSNLYLIPLILADNLLPCTIPFWTDLRLTLWWPPYKIFTSLFWNSCFKFISMRLRLWFWCNHSHLEENLHLTTSS